MDTKKLNALMEWYINVTPDLEAIIVADRDGLLLASKMKGKDLDDETIGGLSAIVEPVLKRIFSFVQY